MFSEKEADKSEKAKLQQGPLSTLLPKVATSGGRVNH